MAATIPGEETIAMQNERGDDWPTPQRMPSKGPARADDAMNRALEAERQALETIEACEREAAKRIDSAHQQARLLIERSDRRIRHIHLHCVRATADLIDAMVNEDARKAEQEDRPESRAKSLERAVDRLAARLTRQTQSDSRKS